MVRKVNDLAPADGWCEVAKGESGLQVYGKKRSNALKVKEIRGEKLKAASRKPGKKPKASMRKQKAGRRKKA